MTPTSRERIKSPACRPAVWMGVCLADGLGCPNSERADATVVSLALAVTILDRTQTCRQMRASDVTGS